MLWNQILWTDEAKKILCQDEGKRKVWRRQGRAHDSTHSNVVDVALQSRYVCLPMEQAHWRLFMEGGTKPDSDMSLRGL